MTPEDRTKLRHRLNRIAGQVEGLQRMVDEDRYCVDILTQIAATRSALDALGVQLLTSHLETCVMDQLTGAASAGTHRDTRDKSKEQLVQEVRTSLARFLR